MKSRKQATQKRKRQPKNQQKNKQNKERPPVPNPNARVRRIPREIVSVSGVATIIPINAQMCDLGFPSSFCSLLSSALSQSLPNNANIQAYAVYCALFSDLQSICNNGTGTTTNRLVYLNEIYSAFSPKTIGFLTGKLSYTWANMNIFSPSPILTINGYNYCLGYNDLVDDGSLQEMQAPVSNPSDIQVLASYSEFLNTMGEKQGRNVFKVVRNVQLGKIFEKNASPFARSSPYYGQGSCSSGAPWSSVELETFFDSPILSTFCAYDPNTDRRASRVLRIGSGDTCSTLGLPLLPFWSLRMYDLKKPVIYKFIDFDEIVFVYLQWICAGKTKFSQILTEYNPGLYDVFPFPLDVVYTAIRQNILAAFADSQAIGQFLSPETSPQGFQAFRVGTNSFPKATSDYLLLPQLLLENIRQLMPSCFETTTSKGKESEYQVVVPILGRYPQNDFLMPLFTAPGNPEPQPFSLAYNSNYPNFIDGYMSGNPYDLNTSYYSQVIGNLNYQVVEMSSVLGTVGELGASGPVASPILLTTRYNSLVQPAYEKMTDPEQEDWQVARLPYKYQKIVRSKRLERSNSKDKKTVDVSKIARKVEKSGEQANRIGDFPGGTDLANIYTLNITSLMPITGELKGLFNLLILPVMALYNSQYSLSEIQTTTCETAFLTFATTSSYSSSTRYSQLVTLANLMAPGLAAGGGVSELSKVYDQLLEFGKGGFLSDLFTTVGQVAGAIGI